jgi:hypothetical protein
VRTGMHISIKFNYIYLLTYLFIVLFPGVSEIYQNGRELCIFILSGEPTARGGGHMPTARYSLSKFLGQSAQGIKFFIRMIMPE